MHVRAQEIDYQKTIGSLNGRPVIEIGTKGGYHIICSPSGRKVDYLGVGPHRRVARFMAKKRAPDLKITELEKSDDIDPVHFQHLMPQYEAMLQALIDAEARNR